MKWRVYLLFVLFLIVINASCSLQNSSSSSSSSSSLSSSSISGNSSLSNQSNSSSSSSNLSGSASSSSSLALPDGSKWECAVNTALFGGRYGHTSLVFNNKIWVIGGCTASPPYFTNDVWYSSDGTNWTCATPKAAFLSRYYHQSLVFQGKMWVIGGFTFNGVSSYIATNDVWYSSDGTNWTCATNSALFSGRQEHASLVYNNSKMWVLGGKDSGSVVQSDSWYSSDGTNWTQATYSTSFGPRLDHTALEFNGKMWVIAGFNNLGSPYITNDVFYSSDGANWTSATNHASFPARVFHSSVVFNNKMWVIAGDFATDRSLITNDVWYSSNGTNWVQATNGAAFPPRQFGSSVVFNNTIWIIGGEDKDTGCYSDVWYAK